MEDLSNRHSKLLTFFTTLFHQHPVSRDQLAKAAKLSPASVSALISELLKSDLVRILGARPSRGGRRADVFELNESARYLIGVDLQGRHVRIALLDLAGNIIRRNSENLEIGLGLTFHRFLLELKSFVSGLSSDEASRVLALGIGIPELLDRQAELLISSNRISWLNISLRKIISQEVSLPVRLARSVDVAIFAESWFGAARAKSNSLIVTFGGGIGCGILLSGKLYTGSSFMAGELGHTTLEPLGVRCYCGKQGCLEMYVSEKKIVENYLDASSAKPETTFTDVIEAARRGDSVALTVIKKGCYYLGLGISHLIHILNPEQIILGGSLAVNGDLFQSEIERVVAEYTMPMLVSPTQILCSTLGLDAGIKGAAASALNEVVFTTDGIERLFHPSGKALIPRSEPWRAPSHG